MKGGERTWRTQLLGGMGNVLRRAEHASHCVCSIGLFASAAHCLPLWEQLFVKRGRSLHASWCQWHCHANAVVGPLASHYKGVGIVKVHVYAEARAKEPQGCQAELIAMAVQNIQRCGYLSTQPASGLGPIGLSHVQGWHQYQHRHHWRLHLAE